jgi:hypothetical protein
MPVFAGGVSQEKEIVAVELGGQPREASRILTFVLCKASPSAYSNYICHIESFLFYCMHVMYYALRVGFLDDGDRLHGCTLPYITMW